MYKEFYANMEWTALPIFALLLFLAVFIGTFIRTFRHRATDYDQLAALPLFGDDHTETKEVKS